MVWHQPRESPRNLWNHDKSFPQYANISPENLDIPPPGPYDFGGGGIARAYRIIVEMKRLWDGGDVQLARIKFDSLYQSLGNAHSNESFDEILADFFYDDRGVPKQQ